MSRRGKIIRIYLVDGHANGLRHAQLGNWTGQALHIPRPLLGQVQSWQEVRRPGVYFLFGPEEEGSLRQVYIGEAEHVYNRLEDHVRTKDFWEQAIVFTSKDDNLTKAHVRYLEATLIKAAKEAGRYQVKNGNETTSPSLPRGDDEMMEEFVEHLRVLLGALGHPVLEPILQPTKGSESAPATVFSCAVRDALAKGVITTEGFVVLKGSTAMPLIREEKWYGAKKQALVENGVLAPVPNSNVLCFQVDHLFGSPSTAASVISGNSVNGRRFWKLEDGRTLEAWENAQLHSAGGPT